MLLRADEEDVNVDSGSEQSAPDIGQQDYTLADAFHDGVIEAQRRCHGAWDTWVSFDQALEYMFRLVPECQACEWNSWSPQEQVEACQAFAEAYTDIGVMANDGDMVRFVQTPLP